MKIALVSDHAGVDLKAYLLEYLNKEGYEAIDLGPNKKDSVDYPDYAQKLCDKINAGSVDLGIAICGTGIGMSIACNKVKGIRASLCSESYSARLTRNHNNSNVLCIGARVVGEELARDIVKVYVESEFEGGRHQKRIDKLEN